MDAALLPESKVFQVTEIVTVNQQWMQTYMQPTQMKVLDADKLFASNESSIIACSYRSQSKKSLEIMDQVH